MTEHISLALFSIIDDHAMMVKKSCYKMTIISVIKMIGVTSSQAMIHAIRSQCNE